MTNRILVVARREYTSVVTKRSFWLATLLIPLLIVVLGAISAVSAKAAKKREVDRVGEAKVLAVHDPEHVIEDALVRPPFCLLYTSPSPRDS